MTARASMIAHLIFFLRSGRDAGAILAEFVALRLFLRLSGQRWRPESLVVVPRPRHHAMAPRPRDARRVGLIVVAALVVAIAALVAMFANNSRYDGTSPIPVGERR